MTRAEPQARAIESTTGPSSHGVAVRIENVSKTYEARGEPVRALDPVSLHCAPGEFVSVLGPSGCGKSTLLLLVAGLLPRTSGTITIDDTLVRGPHTELGIVFQDAVLLDWRKVRGNIMLQVEMRRGLKRKDYRARVAELIDLVGLSGFEDRYPFELSGGMRQRVSLCRALVHDPPLLLMDEPFGALDALTRDQLNLDLQDLWLLSRKTVLFVTHSISEAVFLSDRVVIMSDRPGRVAKVIDIDLPRPRHLAIREDTAFSEYCADSRGVFQELGILRET